MPANAETDPFFTLLTDALRAGPASPQWRDAVAQLRDKGASESDEYRLLITARESLEGGREYRSVRAGPGFTRMLMDRLQGEEQSRRGFPTAVVLAAVCGLAIIAAVVFLIIRVTSGPIEPDQQAIEQLASESNTFFANVASATFSGSLPDGWKQIGSLPLDFGNGLRPAAGPASADAGGGVYLSQGIPADKDFTFETTLTLPKPTDALTLETFVADSQSFSPDRATSPTELNWLLRGREQRVVVNGNVNPDGNSPTGQFPVRITVGREVAIVEVGRPQKNGKTSFHRIWAGAHHLRSSPRFVGVRFLRTGSGAAEDIRVDQIKVVAK